jgi:hypothetical protein
MGIRDFFFNQLAPMLKSMGSNKENIALRN